MAERDIDLALMPSVLDRLIDPDSIGRGRIGYTFEQMRDSVRRDLEDLLNTQQSLKPGPEYPETIDSVVTFGIPELSLLTRLYAERPEMVPRIVEEVILRHEPRLRDVKARVISGGTGSKFSIRIYLEAKLALDPAPEVAFETVLNLVMGHTTVNLADGEAGSSPPPSSP